MNGKYGLNRKYLIEQGDFSSKEEASALFLDVAKAKGLKFDKATGVVVRA